MKTTSLNRTISWPYRVSISDVKTVETNLGDVDFVELRTLKRDVSKRLKHSPPSDTELEMENLTRERPADPINLAGLALCSGLLFSATLVGAFFLWTAPYFDRIYGFGLDASR